MNQRSTMRTTNICTPKCGFTLLEIIIVVGLIAALAGALLSGLQGVARGGQVEIERQFLSGGLNTSLTGYKLNMGSYPTIAQGLNALYEKPSNGGNWHGPYLDKPPVDSWGNAYNYRFPGEHSNTGPDIWSSGPNGQNEEGAGDDVTNWISQ